MDIYRRVFILSEYNRRFSKFNFVGIPDEVGKNLAIVFVEGACSRVNVTRVDFGRTRPLSCAST